MFKYIFKKRNRKTPKEEWLAPETKPIVHEFEIKKQPPPITGKKLDYKLIRKGIDEEYWAV